MYVDELLEESELTEEQFGKKFARVLARLCEKHGVTTQAEVHEIISAHRYRHTEEDPEDEYIQLMAVARATGW